MFGCAIARIKGNSLAPSLNGVVIFRNVQGGTEVHVEVNGLPPFTPAQGDKPQIGPFGFHIHEFGRCVGDFSSTGGHWNPYNQPHGNHAGDFPVLFSNNGYARMSFFTNKFKPWEVIGKSVVIHQSPDDYHTQPAGGSGKRIACGVINSNLTLL